MGYFEIPKVSYRYVYFASFFYINMKNKTSIRFVKKKYISLNAV